MSGPPGAASLSSFSRAPAALNIHNWDGQHPGVSVVTSGDNKLSSGHSLMSKNRTGSQLTLGNVSTAATFAHNTGFDVREFSSSPMAQDTTGSMEAPTSSQEEESLLSSRAIDALVESRLDEEALEDHLWSRVALSGVRPRTSSELLLAVDGLLTSPTPGAAHQYATVTSVHSPLNPGSTAQSNPDLDSDEFILVEAPQSANKKTKRNQVRKALAAISSGVFKLPNLKRKREPDTPGSEGTAMADITPSAEPLPKRLRFQDYYTQETGKTPPLPQITRGLIFGHRSTYSAPDVFGPDKSPKRLPRKSRQKLSPRSAAVGLGIFSPQRNLSASPLANTLMQLALSSPQPIPKDSPKRIAVQGDSDWRAQQKFHFGPAETLPEVTEENDASLDAPLRPSITNFLSSLESPDSALPHMSFSPLSFDSGEFHLEPDSPQPLRPSGVDMWRTREPGSVSSVPFPSMSTFSFTCPPSPQRWAPESSPGPRAFARPGNPTPSASHRDALFNGLKHAWPTRAPKPSLGEDSGYESVDGHGRLRMNSSASTAFDEDMEMEMYDERNRKYSTTESEGPHSYEAHEGYLPHARTASDAEVEVMVGRCGMDVDVFSPKERLHSREQRRGAYTGTGW